MCIEENECTKLYYFLPIEFATNKNQSDICRHPDKFSPSNEKNKKKYKKTHFNYKKLYVKEQAQQIEALSITSLI